MDDRGVLYRGGEECPWPERAMRCPLHDHDHFWAHGPMERTKRCGCLATSGRGPKHLGRERRFSGKDEQAWGRVARCGSAVLFAVRIETKWCGGLARLVLSIQTTALPFPLFSHGHGSSRRFEGISLFLSPVHPSAHSLSKAQRLPDPAQNSYELNPPQQQTTNYGYTNNQNSNYGNNPGNGTSDDFYDEVTYIPSSRPSQVLTQVSPPTPKNVPI